VELVYRQHGSSDGTHRERLLRMARSFRSSAEDVAERAEKMKTLTESPQSAVPKFLSSAPGLCRWISQRTRLAR
jgi:hypothetical protein